MAKVKMFAPYDSKLKVWMNPMFFLHTGQAERAWGEIVNDKNSLPGKHPSDFVLYQVGEFDDDNGSVLPLAAPVQVCTSLSVMRKPEGVLPLERQ